MPINTIKKYHCTPYKLAKIRELMLLPGMEKQRNSQLLLLERTLVWSFSTVI